MATQAQVTGEARAETTTSRPGRWRRFVGAALLASTTMLVVDMAPADAGGACASIEPAAESRFVSKLNSLRQSKGLSSLVVNTGITGPADSWSVHMSSQDKLQHDSNYAAHIAKAVPDWSRAGENVGVSSMSACASADVTVDGLHNAFVNSPGHYGNMVGDFNQVGIGVHTDGAKLWVTVRFAKGSLPKAPTFTQAQLDQAAHYVDATYRLFLNRAASSSDVSRWSGTVAGGNRGALTTALSVSNEWSGTRVTALYQTVLGRAPEASGLWTWVDSIARGMQLETVAARIYGSAERFQAGGSTNHGYVEGLYRDILERPADAGGRDYWVHRLNRGAMTRSQVAAGFYGSIESRTDRVHTLYQEILGRAPDANGLSYWTNRLARMGDVVLASTLATSTEFWNRSTS